jgi:hypothetical protein
MRQLIKRLKTSFQERLNARRKKIAKESAPGINPGALF